ncbi:MAG: GEVED domain-containing protein [Methanosarcinales archaeon]
MANKINSILLGTIVVLSIVAVFAVPATAIVNTTAPSSYGYQTVLDQSYEYINNITWAKNGNGTITMTVEVNLTGTFGDYLTFGEYVNAWVDWNDDGYFNDTDQVMDQVKYAINPPETLLYEVTFKINANGTHWTRVNLALDYDPPSEEATWTYGDVKDTLIEIY